MRVGELISRLKLYNPSLLVLLEFQDAGLPCDRVVLNKVTNEVVWKDTDIPNNQNEFYLSDDSAEYRGTGWLNSDPEHGIVLLWEDED